MRLRLGLWLGQCGLIGNWSECPRDSLRTLQLLLAQALLCPLQAFLSPQAAGINSEGLIKIINTGARACYRRQDEPAFFRIWIQSDCFLGPTTGSLTLARLQGLPGVRESHAEGFGKGFHGVGRGSAWTLSLETKQTNPETMPSATRSGWLTRMSRSKFRKPVSIIAAVVAGSTTLKA